MARGLRRAAAAQTFPMFGHRRARPTVVLGLARDEAQRAEQNARKGGPARQRRVRFCRIIAMSFRTRGESKDFDSPSLTTSLPLMA
jgi:hypothetical protein